MSRHGCTFLLHVCFSRPLRACLNVLTSVCQKERHRGRVCACACVCARLVDIPQWLVLTVVSHNSYQSGDHRKLVSSNETHPSLPLSGMHTHAEAHCHPLFLCWWFPSLSLIQSSTYNTTPKDTQLRTQMQFGTILEVSASVLWIHKSFFSSPLQVRLRTGSGNLPGVG